MRKGRKYAAEAFGKSFVSEHGQSCEAVSLIFLLLHLHSVLAAAGHSPGPLPVCAEKILCAKLAEGAKPEVVPSAWTTVRSPLRGKEKVKARSNAPDIRLIADLGPVASCGEARVDRGKCCVTVTFVCQLPVHHDACDLNHDLGTGSTEAYLRRYVWPCIEACNAEYWKMQTGRTSPAIREHVLLMEHSMEMVLVYDDCDFVAHRAKHTPKPYPNVSLGTFIRLPEPRGESSRGMPTERRHPGFRAHVLPTLFGP